MKTNCTNSHQFLCNKQPMRTPATYWLVKPNHDFVLLSFGEHLIAKFLFTRPSTRPCNSDHLSIIAHYHSPDAESLDNHSQIGKERLGHPLRGMARQTLRAPEAYKYQLLSIAKTQSMVWRHLCGLHYRVCPRAVRSYHPPCQNIQPNYGLNKRAGRACTPQLQK